MTPLFKPLMDVPGLVGLALITDLRDADAGAALTKELYDDGLIDKREQTIIAAWRSIPEAGTISNYFAIAGARFLDLSSARCCPCYHHYGHEICRCHDLPLCS